MMKRIQSLLLLAAAIALIWFSHRLAGIRIYQVDECQNVFVARLVATGQTGNYFSSITLFLAPLVWLGRGISNSVDLFVTARFFCLELFWLNVVLLTVATGEKFFSRRGLVAFVLAATLAPLWDYGFEIRHDNLLLTGLLLLWCAVRVRPAGLQSYFLAGLLAVGLEFVAFKAFVYTIPISLAILIFPPPEYKAPRWKLALVWIAGGLLAFLAVRIGYGASGLWEPYMKGFHGVARDAGNVRFGPFFTLNRLLLQVPLLLAVVMPGLVTIAVDLCRRGKAALNWDGILPEAVLCLLTVAVLFINPAPYPYNLLHLVPYAFLFAYRYATTSLAKEILDRPALFPIVGALVIFAHLVPFGFATRRHWDQLNYHQESLMATTEAMTDPAKDLVFDGVGLVPTRRSIHYQWFLHSVVLKNFQKKGSLRLRDMLAARPAAVVIQNYRTDWLPKEDLEFIHEHYVPLSDDFWVLGKILPCGGGAVEIAHPGRYCITSREQSNIVGTYAPPKSMFESDPSPKSPPLVGTLDGVPLTNAPLELTAGMHRIEVSDGRQPAVVWVGPQLDHAPRMNSSDHRELFVNWY